ncbi:general secretion pathway protein GspB [Rheinheimera baltica]|uniref:general secretion pathway protein GspB n=1 Tax=Rheinheimera baltica TaxID=67576 RepID=UPI000402549E|nr:general secretion pathway protein GspB [Rheinheimera baltica]MDP5190698.1 general secretion pathway protein GspB [Rheinheimera baltica]
MSILMAALKQQTQANPTAGDNHSFWRKLALVLALLLALMTGAVVAYLLTPVLQPALLPAAEPEPVQVAAPEKIFATLNVDANPSHSNRTKVQLEAELAQVISPAPAPVVETLSAAPAIKTVTVGTAAAEPVPQTAVTSAIAAEQEPVVEVSAELRDMFASALQASEQNLRQPAAPPRNASPATDINSLSQTLQQQIPALRFDAHVYATRANQRWVKVNGKNLQEGQWITAEIRIKEIMPQYVLMERGELLFSMAALSSWAG